VIGEVPVIVRDVGEGVYRTVRSSVVHKGRYGGRAGVEAEREYAFVYLKRGCGSLVGFETGVLRIRRRARHRRGQSLEGDRWRCDSCSMGSICAAVASSSADWEGSGISEALGGRAGVLACCSWVQG